MLVKMLECVEIFLVSCLELVSKMTLQYSGPMVILFQKEVRQ